MNPAGAVALVTGASSGIGEAVARALADGGATVIAAARRLDRLERLSGVEPLALDVTRDEEVAAALDRIRARHGRLDILVNAAGVMMSAAVADAKTGDWRRIIETNLLGLMNVTHAALPLMRAAGSGHIDLVTGGGKRLPHLLGNQGWVIINE